MVNALVQIDEQTNRVLNVVKAKHSLKDKGEAIAFVVQRFVELEEPSLNPAFIAKMKRIGKEPTLKLKSLRERYSPRDVQP